MEQTTELTFFPTWTAGRKGYADRIGQIFDEYHRSKGLRVTDQRKAILAYLLNAERHLSHADIVQALKSKRIGKVTVFRTMKVLEDCKLVEPVTGAKGETRYEVIRERPHHDHLICVECNRIFEIQWPQVEKIQEKVCRDLGFQIIYHRHEIFGRCKGCREK